MSKEYTYSMPESFMKDQSVPARWRILGIINGFSIAGKPCYASNDWFAKELGCSIHTISNGFTELETSKEIYCYRTKRSRVAYRVKPEIETNFHLRPQPTSISDSNQLPPISDSNADSEIGALEDELRVEKESNSDSPSRFKPAKYPNARTAFSWLPNPQESWDGNTTQLICGELLFKRGEDAVRKFVRYVKEHEDDEGFDWIFVQPSDYERKWETIKKYAKRNR